MKPPVLKIHELNTLQPILIVDRIGVIGEALAQELCNDYLIVLVSPRVLSEKNEKIVHLPFKRKIPQVPDNRYSKIFIVDDGELVTRQSAFSFITKARETTAALFFIGSIRNVDVSHADEVVTSYSHSKVLIFGDLFDKNIFFDKDEAINRYILQARKNKKIEVAGNGLALSFPISFKDTIKLIIKASYLEIPQKIILLFYPHPITDISLANIFQKINPDIVVDFTKDIKRKEIYVPPGAQHAIVEYKLEEKIRQLDLENSEDRELRIVNKTQTNRKNILKPVLFVFLVFLFLILLPFMTTSVYALLGQKELNSARVSAKTGDFLKARKQVNNSKTFFEIALKTSEPLRVEAQFLGLKKDSNKMKDKIETGETVSQASLYLLDGAELLKNIYSGKSRDAKNDFSNASNSFKAALELIQKAKAQGNLGPMFEKEIDNIGPFIDLFSNSSDILPDILGFEKEKTYLVIFQNNTQLRPGGGLIGSFGVLKVRNGRITDFSVSPVSEADKKLAARIEPPFAIKRYLPQVNLTLQNSNFDPDFVNSAIAASNIYSLATKNKADGVIGVDLAFAKNIISALGPVTISLGKTVDENNLYELALSTGSAGNKDFLGQVAKSISQTLGGKTDKPYFSLTQEIGKSIKEKHLIFAFQKSSFQNIFTANDWSSSLWDDRQKQVNKINDFIGLSEANLGKNEVNYYVSRSISKRLLISNHGNVSSKLTIGFKNNSPKNNKSDGDYKNYLQLILPEGSIINSISIDGEEVKVEKAITDSSIYGAKNFKPPLGLEVDEENEMNKNIFGFLLIVPSSQLRTVTVVYDLPYALPQTKKSIGYSLKVYKQPGVDSYPFDLSFSLPQNYHILGDDNFSEEIKNDKEFLSIIAQK